MTLGLVAAAMSSMLKTPVITYDEYVAAGYDVGSAQNLDLSAIHANSLTLIRLSEEDTGSKTGLIKYSEGDTEGDAKIVKYSKAIQIFIKTLSGKSHAMFVHKSDTVLDLKHYIQKQFGYDTTKMRLEFASKELQDFRTLSSYNIQDNDNIYILFRLLGGSDYDGYVLRPEFLSPSYDYDFTNLQDNTVYIRGKETYSRPYGWQRKALNVLGRFGPDDKWLGCVGDSPDEWPVSYHGTQRDNADSIAGDGYLLSRGIRFAFGEGIYSTPDVSIAETYATEFQHNGVNWKVVFQNRVNPAGLRKEYNDQYWVIPEETNIRPYGLLFKKLP